MSALRPGAPVFHEGPGAVLVHGDATRLADYIEPASVDLIVTSPPYFALRSYQDGGEHYDGQIGSEETPGAFLEALWLVTEQCQRVLRPSGSMFVNLGDKYAGSGGHNNAGLSSAGSTLEGTTQQDRGGRVIPPPQGKVIGQGGHGATRRSAPDRYNQAADVPRKSLMGLPWRYAIGCTDPSYRAAACPVQADPLYPDDVMVAPDGEPWVLRSEIVWSKPNGLPESVTDRVRRSHEQWFHLTKEPTYFAGIDEIREQYTPGSAERIAAGFNPIARDGESGAHNGASRSRGNGEAVEGYEPNPLGKLPGSVWTVSTEPLKIPAHLDVDHFAAFPQEWPRRLILGWSPAGYCLECGEPRRALVEKVNRPAASRSSASMSAAATAVDQGRSGLAGDVTWMGSVETTITGYGCACDKPTAPTRPAVVLDPFGGTGTVAMVARALGRYGISVDLSLDYLRLAKWRVWESGHAAKALARTHREAQGSMFGGAA